MKLKLEEAIDILSRTPNVLAAMLKELPENWSCGNEGAGTWSPYDVMSHLFQGEKVSWVPRIEIILSESGDKRFVPLDREAQSKASMGKSLQDLLAEFTSARKANIDQLRRKKLNAADLAKQGIHPAFGTVTLEQFLATWVVHDLNHIAQIVRVMAHQYDAAVGPWKEYLGILNVKRK